MLSPLLQQRWNLLYLFCIGFKFESGGGSGGGEKYSEQDETHGLLLRLVESILDLLIVCLQL